MPRWIRVLVFAGLSASRTLLDAVAAEIHVSAAACPLVGSGTIDDPFCSAQDGVEAAVSGDIVRLAPGRYTATSVRPIDVGGFADTIEAVLFLKDGVQVVGAGPNVSIVDAGGRAGGVVADRCGPGTLLAGMSIQGAGRGSGGGFDFADGLFVNAGAPRLTDLEVLSTEDGIAAVDVYDGAMPVIERLHVRDNGRVTPVGAAVFLSGGALASVESSAIIGNHGLDGGGIVVEDGGLSLVDTVVAGNEGASGGGIRLVRAASVVLAYSTIAANTSGTAGAGVLLESSSATVRGCLVVGNRSLSGQVGGVFVDPLSQPVFEGNDVFGNLDADYQSRFNPTGTNGNLSQDPRFVGFPVMDFRLADGSPAIDRGPAPSPSADAWGVRRPLDGDRDGIARPDIGALEFDRHDVRGLTLAGTGLSTRLVWTAISDASGYLVHRGTLADLRAGRFGGCLTFGGDVLGESFDDPERPPPGEMFFYLVTARVSGAEQTLGFDWLGLERIGRPADQCP